jgi:ACS family glucarate transporter-like MFS transporter
MTWGWRLSFVACGVLGVLIAVIWHVQSTEAPEQHAGVNPAELSLIQANRDPATPPSRFPWHRIFAAGTSLPALLVANFMLGYVTYIFYTWFFLYLVNVRNLPLVSGSYWSTAPFLAMLAGAPLGGAISDHMLRRLGHPWGRRVPVLVAALGSCLLLLIGSRLTDPYYAIVLLAVAAGCNSVAAVSSWALPNDLSQRYSGLLGGVLNTSTNLGGALSPILTPMIASRFGWVAALDFAAVLMFTLGLLWLLVHPERRID